VNFGRIKKLLGKSGMINKFLILKKFWKNKKVFITGHTGFKGSWLSLMLYLFGAKVYGYSLRPDQKPNLFEIMDIKNKISSSVIGDIRDYNNLKKNILKASPKFIIHMAAQSLVLNSYAKPKYTYDVNTLGTINLLNIINDYKFCKFNLFITTDKVYLNKNKKIFFKEKDQLGGHDPYSASKACAEIAIESYNKSYFKKKKIFVASARAGNIIGGGDFSKNRILPDYFRSLVKNKKITLRDPKSIRPWQFVLEPLYGYLLILMKLYKKKSFSNEISFNFGPKKKNNINVEKLISLLNDKFNNCVTIKKKYKLSKKHESKLLMLNSIKAKRILKWESKLNIKTTIELIADWHKEFLKNKKDICKISEDQIRRYFNRL
jgi:CDP-glucose 4,6-dehydratase